MKRGDYKSEEKRGAEECVLLRFLIVDRGRVWRSRVQGDTPGLCFSGVSALLLCGIRLVSSGYPGVSAHVWGT